MIPEKILQEIQDRSDAVQVIGAVVGLKKAGRVFKGLCPFHPEKTPSFMVYPDKQFYICYGCGAGGDLISFVMRHEQMEFSEAVEFLAAKAGIPVPQTGGGRGGAAGVGRKLYEPMEKAAAFFEACLRAPEGEAARSYLKKRGLNEAAWSEHRIGFAPTQWDRLLQAARDWKIEPGLLEQGGLVIRREGERGGWYDRFRDRVIFPICDSRGRVIAFGGRAMTEDERTPKYLNSPETELYVKGWVLYGLNWSSAAIRKQDFCVVVEGYMDFLTPYQAGVRNVVASMGTALTETQVRLIRRFTRNVVMVYDADAAGEMAALRGLELFLEAQMRVKVAVLPPGTDPDSLIRSRGVEPFAAALKNSKDFFDYKLEVLSRQFDPKGVAGQVRICEEMLPTIKRVPNAIQKADYIRRLGGALRVEESLLWTELKKIKGERKSSPEKPAVSLSIRTAAVVRTAEENLAALLLDRPARIAAVNGRLERELFRDPDVIRLLDWLEAAQTGGTLPADGAEALRKLPREPEGFQARAVRWLADADSFEDKEGALEKVIQRIEKDRRRSSLALLQDSIRQAEQAGDHQKKDELVGQFNRLLKTGTVERG